MNIVIIGNGISGISAAIGLRELNNNINITLISNESKRFFSRTALMYEFIGQIPFKDLFPYEDSFYKKNKFNCIFNTVLDINTEQKEVIFKDKTKVTFDKLIIACGSTARKATWQKDISGICNFVNLKDLEKLKIESKKAIQTKTKKAFVVGGGLIGIETAEILLLSGFNVDFLIRDKWYWPIALDQRESKLISIYLEKHGLNVRFNTEITELISDKNNNLKSAILNNNQTEDLDLLMLTIGVVPNTKFLENTNLILNERTKAVEVNDYLETNIKDIYAIGDCASVKWFDGVKRPEQLWYTGRDQGKLVANNILNRKKEYIRGTFYNSAKFFDIEYTTAGLVNFKLDNCSQWYHQDLNKYKSQRIIVQNNKVIGFNMIGSRWDHRYFIEWIENNKDLEFVLKNLYKATFDAEFSDKYKINNQNVLTEEL